MHEGEEERVRKNTALGRRMASAVNGVTLLLCCCYPFAPKGTRNRDEGVCVCMRLQWRKGLHGNGGKREDGNYTKGRSLGQTDDGFSLFSSPRAYCTNPFPFRSGVPYRNEGFAFFIVAVVVVVVVVVAVAAVVVVRRVRRQEHVEFGVFFSASIPALTRTTKNCIELILNGQKGCEGVCVCVEG